MAPKKDSRIKSANHIFGERLDGGRVADDFEPRGLTAIDRGIAQYRLAADIAALLKIGLDQRMIVAGLHKIERTFMLAPQRLAGLHELERIIATAQITRHTTFGLHVARAKRVEHMNI